MRYLKILVGLFALLLMPISQAADQTGNITVLRATSDSDIHPTDRHDIILFQLSSTLHTNCSWLLLTPENDYFASVLLSAQAKNQAVRVWYDEANPVSRLCEVYTIQVSQ